MAAPSVTTPSSTASANAALVGRFGRMVTMLAVGYPSAGDSQSLLTGELPSGCKLLPSQPDQATIAAQGSRSSDGRWLHADHHLWVLIARAHLKGWSEPAMEFIWDLFVFLVLVAVGLVVLNLLARMR
jgi:hypothetical protein